MANLLAGYVSIMVRVRAQGEDAVRKDGFHGRLHAVRYAPELDAIEEIRPKEWKNLMGPAAGSLLTGYWFDAATMQRWHVLVPEASKTKRQAAHGTDQVQRQPGASPPDAAAPAEAPSAYLPELIVLALRAVEHFRIGPDPASWPKKSELEEYFRARKLSDGTPISHRLAVQLATFCRPPAAMRGGNKR